MGEEYSNPITTMATLEEARTLGSLTAATAATDDLGFLFDVSTNSVKSLSMAQLREVICGTVTSAPDSYVAPVASTASWVVGGSTVTLTAVTEGVAGDDLTLALVSTTASTISFASVTSATATQVLLKSDVGDAGTATMGSGDGELVVTHHTAGDITAVLYTYEGLASGDALVASEDGDDLVIYAAMDTGTAASGTISDAGTGATSEIAVTAPSGVGVDPTDFDAVTFASVVPAAALSAFAISEASWPAVVISLETDASGDVVPIGADALATALGSFAGTNFVGADWTFDPGANTGAWDSYNAPQALGTPAVPFAVLTDGSNSVNTVIIEIEASTSFTATNGGGAGTDDFTPDDSAAFVGGGANWSETATVNGVVTALNLVTNKLFTAALVAGTGSETVTVDADAATFSGGVDEVTGTIHLSPFLRKADVLYVNTGTYSVPDWQTAALT